MVTFPGQQVIVKEMPAPDFFKSDVWKMMQKERPTWQSLLDQSGQLKAPFRLDAPQSNIAELDSRLAGINLDTRALNALRAEGLRDPGSESPWARMAREAQGIEEQSLLDRIARSGAAATASGFSNLARRGGVSQGARERIASMGALNQLRGQQEVAGQGAAARAKINMTDEENRLNTLRALPGMELASLEPALRKTNMWAQLADQEAGRKFDAAKFNTANTIGERDKRNEFEMGRYSELMKAWGADRTARAQENSGKK